MILRDIIARLDGALFEPDSWFLIDDAQTKVCDVATLEAALAALGPPRGRPAAVVGRLRREVAAVDVDAGGTIGDAIAQQLTGWLTARGRWHLLRPSGGGPGRWHVFCVPGEDAAALAAYVADLRTTHGLAVRDVDHRGAGGGSPWLRPLSSPHRRTGRTPPPVGTRAQLDAALAHLRTILPTQSTTRRASARQRRADRAARGRVVALVPLPRRAQDLPSPWRDWIEGTAAAPTIGGRDQSRSAVELAATSALLRAGYDVDHAWQLISTSRADAFDRSRDRGRSWWVRHHWNHAVVGDTTWRTTTAMRSESRSQNDYGPGMAAATSSGPSVDTLRAVEAARAALTGLQWRFGHRQRHSALLVAHTLLDRMLRVDELAVPCPLRDLELDTGLARGTVLAALRLLHGSLGRRLETFDPSRAEASSHVFELSTGSGYAGLSLLEPPSVTPTHRQPAPPGTWAALPPLAHSVWRGLGEVANPSHRDPEQPDLTTEQSPATRYLEQLAHAAGLTHGPTAVPTPRQLRTLRSALEQLVTAGLVTYERDGGGWTATDIATPTHQRRASATHRLILDRITRERAHYHAGVASRWQRERLGALRRNRARQRGWWAGLADPERDLRRRRRAAWFATLPLIDQAAVKHRIASARHRAGEPSERSTHAAWSRTYSRAEQADLSAAWQLKLASLSPAQRAQRLQLLTEHRNRWNLPPTWATSSTSTGHVVTTPHAA